ncbi:MAG: DNA primase catalytic subunit PriS [Methermicoccaceae archaeon]
MNERTLEFVAKRFRSYYAKAHIPEPPMAAQREWAFVGFEGFPSFVMRRHMGFSSFDEVLELLRVEPPMHAYYSTALYDTPSAPVMQKKGWRGAELIFDLDADHLTGVPDSYAEMLELVKKETLKLITLLTEDFGFEDVHIVFSGGRGYHVHIHDEGVFLLGSAERREIVDYVSATGIQPDYMLESWRQGVVGGGWSARLLSCVGSRIAQYDSMERSQAMKLLKSIPSIGVKRAQKVLEVARRIRAGERPERWASKVADMSALTFPLLQGYIKECVKELSCEVDEPVSTDIKRLIRLEGSLHGKTAFRVVPIKDVDALRTFEPLTDAIAFSDTPVGVKVLAPTTTEFLGTRQVLEEGKHELPEYAALYLMCRGIAEWA